MEKKAIKVHPEDNVAVALIDVWKDNLVQVERDEVKLLTDTKAKDKFSVVDLAKGGEIFMCGILVGKATRPVNRGEVLTVDNVKHESNQVYKKTEVTSWGGPDISKLKNRTFNGCQLSDGQVGTKNVWLFFFLVFCENKNNKKLKDVFEYELSFHKSSRRCLLSFAGIKKANEIQIKLPLSKIKLGLECGGSDGFSGISANPALGYASDLLAALKGSPILAEFPELCGIEQELVNRCVSDDIAEHFIELTRAYEKAAIASGSGFDMNPSPGNIKDGLITDAMKSAGAAKKGGTSLIEDVLDYGDYVTKSGLNLLNTPWNDVESTTAIVGSGASIVVFQPIWEPQPEILLRR